MDTFSESEVARFFNGRSVFITGATGFMGKVLVEKLLRSCPGIKSLYLLLRSKKGLAPRQRLEQLLNDRIFERLREENPKALSKIISIEGDITVDGLGISPNDLNQICKNVSVIFHSAATVKFEEPLRVAVNYNMLGTRRVIKLAHQIPQLASLVHVSTCYANCDRPKIDEMIYDQKITPQQLIEAVEWMSDDMIETILPKILGNRPNTYTLTKALAETMITEECGSLPVAIVRPAIVTAARKEPYPGWVDNINNVTGIFLASAKGVLRSLYLNSDSVLDIVPVDTVINMMIAVAWSISTRPQNSILVYHCSSGTLNPITIDEIAKHTYPLAIKYPCSEHFRYPNLTIRSNRFIYNMSVFFDHYIPAYIFDTVTALVGGNRTMVRLYDKLFRATEQLVFFATRQWQFKSTNVPELQEQLNTVDRETFCFDVKQIHWPTYLKDYYFGVRRFILKEDNSNIPSARKHLKKLYITNKIIETFFYFGVFNAVLYQTGTSYYVWSSIKSKLLDLIKN